MIQIIWNLEEDLDGNYHHILEHDVTPDEVAEILNNPRNATGESESSGSPITFGWTAAGRYLAVVWELVEADPLVAYPITAYPVPEPKRRTR